MIRVFFDDGGYIEIEDKYVGFFTILNDLKDKEDYIKIGNYIIPKIKIKCVEEIKKEEDVNVTTCEQTKRKRYHT